MRTKRVRTRSQATPETVPEATLRCANPDCAVEFVPLRPWHRYHSTACRVSHWKRRTQPGSRKRQTKAVAPHLPKKGGGRRLTIYCVMDLS